MYDRATADPHTPAAASKVVPMSLICDASSSMDAQFLGRVSGTGLPEKAI